MQNMKYIIIKGMNDYFFKYISTKIYKFYSTVEIKDIYFCTFYFEKSMTSIYNRETFAVYCELTVSYISLSSSWSSWPFSIGTQRSCRPIRIRYLRLRSEERIFIINPRYTKKIVIFSLSGFQFPFSFTFFHFWKMMSRQIYRYLYIYTENNFCSKRKAKIGIWMVYRGLITNHASIMSSLASERYPDWQWDPRCVLVRNHEFRKAVS